MRKLDLPLKLKCPIFASGADMKGSFAISDGRQAFFSDGFGDLGELSNLKRYESAATKAIRSLKKKIKIVVCDTHPGYFSSQFALTAASCTGARVVRMQHHHAHIAGAMIENSLKGEVVGVSFDGTGYGTDGNIWGGEFFTGSLRGFKRASHLDYISMPGGEAAVREPWRMAASYLFRAYGNRARVIIKKRFNNLTSSDIESSIFSITKRFNAPMTSSAGRLFDAAGSMVFGHDKQSSQALMPVELEKIADYSQAKYSYHITSNKDMCTIDMLGMIKGINGDLDAKTDKRVISGKIHRTIAEMIFEMSSILKNKYHIIKTVLSGGVFQNKVLLNMTKEIFAANGMTLYNSGSSTTGDAGISIGQLAAAGMGALCV